MMIGIDLGTTNSLVSVYRNGRVELIPNRLGKDMTGSAVSVLEDGSLLVGDAARERLVAHGDRTAVSFKRFMGTEQIIRLADKTFTPQELSALVLRQLYEDARAYLQEEIEEAVISVPAYFDDNQRNATKLAAELAGLPVKRLINEPSAAALSYSLSAGREDCCLMIVDFGGGTLDVSIVQCFENVIEIIAIAGDNRLGGDDVDRAIAAYFCSQHSLTEGALSTSQRESLLRQAEAAKKALSQEGNAPRIRLSMDGEHEMVLDKALLRQICQPLLDRIKPVIARAVRDSQLMPAQLDDIVLVGGSAKLAVLADYLQELMGKRPLTAENPERIVAQGAGICAGIKSRREELKDMVMTDVCPFSLGIAVANEAGDRNLHMATMIPRSSMLPASHRDYFYTLSDNQEWIRFQIYQGESYYAEENRKLGELTVRVPADRAGIQYAEVNFAYDINGILHVEAKSSGGDVRETVIVNPKVHLKEEELKQKVEELRQLQFAGEDDQEDLLLMARAERLFIELTGERRKQVGMVLSRLQHTMKNGGLVERKKLRREVTAWLEGIEDWVYDTSWELSDVWKMDKDDRQAGDAEENMGRLFGET